MKNPARRNTKPYFHPKALVESGDIGAGSRVWAFAHIMKGASIGKDCNIGDHSFLEGGVRIGDRVTVKNGVSLWSGVALDDDVFVGPNAAFTNDRFPVSRRNDFKLEPTRVKRGAAIGANSTIVCGVTVGAYAMIGAGSVVTDDIPDHALVYGNPARIRGSLCVCRKKLKFISGSARCGCGQRFMKTKTGITVK